MGLKPSMLPFPIQRVIKSFDDGMVPGGLQHFSLLDLLFSG